MQDPPYREGSTKNGGGGGGGGGAGGSNNKLPDCVEEVLTRVRARRSQKGKLVGTEPRTGTGTVV